jgi:hypothetical protein
MVPPLNKRIPALVGVILAAGLGLAACSMPAPTVSASDASNSKDAGLFTKNVFVCIENSSTSPVTVEWTIWINSVFASGQLAVGQKFCAEGLEPGARITYDNGFSVDMHAVNLPFTRPTMAFSETEGHLVRDCPLDHKNQLCPMKRVYDQYTKSSYDFNVPIDNEFLGHHISANREADNDFINFNLKIAS